MEREGIVPQYIQLLKEWAADMLKVVGKDDLTIAVQPTQAPTPRSAPLPAETRPGQGHRTLTVP